MILSFSRLAAIALVVGVVPLPAAAAATTDAAAQLEPVIVSLARDAGPPQAVADETIARFGGERGFVYMHALRGFSAQLPAPAIAALRNNPSVLAVTFDRAVSLAQDPPTGYDRTEADLRGGTGVPVGGGCPTGETCTDVDIAILDTGIAPHADLNIVARTDCSVVFLFITSCYDGEGADNHGHGTHVAGIAAAFDNGFGVVGIAPGARLYSVKVLGDDGTGLLSGIIAGVDWVTARAGQIDVINMSLAGEFSDANLDAAIDGAVDAGVIVVVAAGNSNRDAAAFSPAGHPSAVTVSAVADADGAAGGLSGFRCRKGEIDDTLASFSNWGAVVDIAAPGVCITSTYRGGGYAVASGTSMASPHVAGAAALYVAINGRDADGNGTIGRGDVEAVKAAMVSAGHAQGSTCGFAGDRDAFGEPLLFVNGPAFGGDGTCTVEPVDSTPPTAPSSFTAQADGYPIDLAWTAADDPESGILEYRIYRNGEFLASASHTATSYQDRATDPGTEYTYSVEAVNLQFGSVVSGVASATTSSDDPTDAGWWGFEGVSGTEAEDSSAWRRDASLVNGPGRVTAAVGGGIQLDGADDRVDLDPAVLDGATDVTYALWIRTLKTGMQALVSGANPGNDNEVFLYLASSTELRYHVGYDPASGVAWTLPYSVADGEWHHLAVIRNQTLGQAWAYLDGDVVGGWGVGSQYLQNLEVDFLTVGQDQDSVGGGFQSSDAFSGMLDEVRLYTRVLSAADIAALAGVEVPPAAPTGLVASGGVEGVTVSWDVLAGMEYTVERADGGGGVFAVVASGLTASPHEDRPLEPGVFSYRLRAHDPSTGLMSEPSVEVSAASAPPAPSGLLATAGVEQVDLVWGAVAAASYNVYRAVDGGAPSLLVSGLTEASYVDAGLTAGLVHAYTVTAVVNGVESAASEESSATPESPPADPPAPVYATSQTTFSGSVVRGDLGSLQSADGDVQVLREQHNGGRPLNRVSSLDHRWTFELGSAVAQTLLIGGYRPANDEGDDFQFSISVNGGGFGVVLHTVNQADPDTAVVALSDGVTGTVVVRVVDANRTQGFSDLDEVHLDQLYLLAVPSGEPEPDPDPEPPSGTHHPTAETTSFGSTTGSLLDVQASDDSYEVVNEDPWSGGSRTRLEHTWTFEIPVGSTMTLVIEAMATGGESFDILASHDGSNWAAVSVVGSTETTETLAISGPSTGVVYVRAVDQNRSRGDSIVSSIRVDYLAITVR